MIFSNSEVKKIGFSRHEKFGEISEKITKNRKSAQKGRICCGIDPKQIFWTLGGLCGQNESIYQHGTTISDDFLFS